MPTILFFDLDNTIMVNPFESGVFPVILRELSAKTGRTSDALRKEILGENRRRQREQPDHPLTMDWDDIVEGIAGRYQIDLSARVLDLVHAYCAPEHIRVIDDAPDVLRELKKGGRRLVVATKGLSKYQFPVLRALGLYDLFDDYLTPDRTGYLKTEPGYYWEYTRNHAGYLLIQIGDHYYDDVLRPKLFGLTSVLRAPIPELRTVDPFARAPLLPNYRDHIRQYPSPRAEVDPDAVVVHLAELPQVISQLESLKARGVADVHLDL